MTTWFVTRHAGAIDWAREEGILNAADELKVIDSLEPETQIQAGDKVIGTLPVHLVAEICARGGHYFHLAMQVPLEKRGKELSAAEMREFGGELREYLVLGQHPVRKDIAAEGGIHICIVSDQHFANLLPILKRKPSHVILVCTPEMTKEGRGLDKHARALQHFGYGEERITPFRVDNASSTDFAVARAEARRLRNYLAEKMAGQSLTLNATGGTKALSTAFFLEFQGFEIIYTDTHPGNCIRFLEEQNREPELLGKVIPTIADYLQCQGYVVSRTSSADPDWCAQASQRTALTQLLAKHSDKAVLSILNGALEPLEIAILGKKRGKNLASAERDRQLDAKLPKQPIPGLKTGWLTEKLCQAGLLLCNDQQELFFPGVEALRYLTGGWLEEWAWSIANACEPDDVAANVFVRSLATGDNAAPDRDDNELDLVILHNNRLLIAECKTIHWQGANAKQEIFNKLDALGTHARGLFGQSLLISAKPLDEIAQRRAKAYGIKVLQADGLSGLKNEILRWMGKSI